MVLNTYILSLTDVFCELAIYIADALSAYMTHGLPIRSSCPTSCRKSLSHLNSETHSYIAIYSECVEEGTTSLCFLLRQHMTPPASMKQYPEIEILLLLLLSSLLLLLLLLLLLVGWD
jgi:hypothetical protein